MHLWSHTAATVSTEIFNKNVLGLWYYVRKCSELVSHIFDNSRLTLDVIGAKLALYRAIVRCLLLQFVRDMSQQLIRQVMQKQLDNGGSNVHCSPFTNATMS